MILQKKNLHQSKNWNKQTKKAPKEYFSTCLLPWSTENELICLEICKILSSILRLLNPTVDVMYIENLSPKWMN